MASRGRIGGDGGRCGNGDAQYQQVISSIGAALRLVSTDNLRACLSFVNLHDDQIAPIIALFIVLLKVCQ